MAGEPTLTREGESFFLAWPAERIVLEFSRLTDHRDTLSAEICVIQESAGFVHWSRINLASATGRAGVVKVLDHASPGPPWRRMLDLGCQLVARAYRQPEPAVMVTAQRPEADRWLIDPWIPLGKVTILYGDGGTGKSLLALAIGVMGILGHRLGPWHIAGLSRILYLDWEEDQPTVADRLWGLTSQLEPLAPETLIYRRLHRPLTDELVTVRGDMDRYHPDYVICDALGPASGPEPEAADAAIRTMMAVRSLGTTVLVPAHVSKASADLPQSRPFGSVYVANLARSTIEARRHEEQSDEHGFTVSLYHRKANHRRAASAIALTISFDAQSRITITSATPDLRGAGRGAQILDAMRSGSKTVRDLAEELGQSEAAIKSQLHRLKSFGKVIPVQTVSGGRGHQTQWGRVDTKRSEEPW